MKSAFYTSVLTWSVSLSLSFYCFFPSAAVYASSDETVFHSKKHKSRFPLRDRRATVGDEVDKHDVTAPKGKGRKGSRSTSLLVPLHPQPKGKKSKRRLSRKQKVVGEQDPALILELPDEIFFHIASFVPPHDILSMMHVCTQWRSSLRAFKFNVRASVRFTGQSDSKTLFTRSSDAEIRFLPSHPDILEKVSEVTLLGKYPGEHANEKEQKKAKERLRKSLHADLKVLNWHRSSRVMPLDYLITFLPNVRSLHSLSLTGGILKSGDLLKLLMMPCLSGLKHLDVSENCLDGGFLDGISSLACRENLESLFLSFNHLGIKIHGVLATQTLEDIDEADHQEDTQEAQLSTAEEIFAAASGASASLFPRLMKLHLAGNEFATASARQAMGAFGSLPQLQELDVRRNDLEEGGLLDLLGVLAPSGRLKTLDARNAQIRHLSFLVHPSCFALETLRLDANALEERVAVLGTARCAVTLKSVSLSQTSLASAHLEELLNHAFPNLEKLTLSSNPLAGGAQHLCPVAILPKLQRLSLCHTGTHWQTIATLIKTRYLTFLDVRKNGALPSVRGFWEERLNPHLTIVPEIELPSPSVWRFTYDHSGREEVRDVSPSASRLVTHNSFGLLEELAS